VPPHKCVAPPTNGSHASASTATSAGGSRATKADELLECIDEARGFYWVTAAPDDDGREGLDFVSRRTKLRPELIAHLVALKPAQARRFLIEAFTSSEDWSWWAAALDIEP
jgi:hypothetical protein